jgi:hypothetical protein
MRCHLADGTEGVLAIGKEDLKPFLNLMSMCAVSSAARAVLSGGLAPNALGPMRMRLRVQSYNLYGTTSHWPDCLYSVVWTASCCGATYTLA